VRAAESLVLLEGGRTAADWITCELTTNEDIRLDRERGERKKNKQQTEKKDVQMKKIKKEKAKKMQNDDRVDTPFVCVCVQ